ncbi:MAG: DUF4189 domain-containing protein [Ignavibacteria bacterium]|nr:DUF4189 domain-containing protein [Ignavibacteria bacterium]
MKKTISAIFVFLLFFIISPRVFSQSAVYFCSETGAYGFSYGFSSSETLTKAYNACLSYGGTKPVLVTSTDKKGFGAIALGNDANGNRVIGVALGYSNSGDAKNEAIKQCQNYGGSGVYISDTWNDK